MKLTIALLAVCAAAATAKPHTTPAPTTTTPDPHLHTDANGGTHIDHGGHLGRRASPTEGATHVDANGGTHVDMGGPGLNVRRLFRAYTAPV